MDERDATMTDGHIVVDVDGGNVLIDTGSPFTLGRTPSTLSLAGIRIDVQRLPASQLDLDRLGQLVGERIDVVLGMDALDRIGFRLRTAPVTEIGFFDLDGATSRDIAGRGWTRVQFSRLAGVPLIEVAVPGNARAKALFDTGAVISFAPSFWLNNMPYGPVGKRPEFYIGVAGLVETETPVWNIVIDINGLAQLHEFGVMPTPFEAMLRLFGVEFIVGTQVILDPAVEELVFRGDEICLKHAATAVATAPNGHIVERG